MRAMLGLAAVVVSTLLAGSPSFAKIISLESSQWLRVVNPVDAGDVRVFLVFDIPAEVRSSMLIVAKLRLPAAGTEERIVIVSPAIDEWSGSDTWSTLAARRIIGLSEASDALCRAACNVISEDGGGRVNSGFEFVVTEIVQMELDRETRRGVCVSRMRGRSDELGSVFDGNVIQGARLVIVYDSAE